MRSLLALAVLLLLAACHKDGGEEPEPAASPPCGSFTGIHMRDANAHEYGTLDSTDWTWKDDWCDAAEALFADRPPVILDTLPPDSLTVLCFSNPSLFGFDLLFYREDVSYIDLRLVNEQFGLLYSADSITGSGAQFPNGTLGVIPEQIIRAYYRVVHPDGTAHRGHGDIRMWP